ncbi:ATP-binding protein [Plantibacter sp. VKM Ac-2876]|uniref:ATP-binding protein n=1 Tax=Plantibacter sp. VKM Ac-2876 TaxID=2783826 RepID=UPI00188C5F36|nr:ATP-binding protein [Plantibacter sp. VKM Ac-2876]MBF4566154.1 ATP-binding protein [Plantibacter sp. VKM Ac-2876]
MSETERSAADNDLRDQILDSRNGEPVHTALETDAQVIARVTDGIYSQPASAFRELISNAYDADATEVVIQTDRPRFQRITISDNGNGMGPEAVAHLIRHIGGSAKRSAEGVGLGITKSIADPSLSPGGRKLIGKVGIGLFSVSHLTQSFQIITKVANESWRTIASIRLRQYSEVQDHIEGDPYEAGLVTIWQEPASDVEAKGTTIVLNGLKPAARDTLRSSATWLGVSRGMHIPPRYHVGAVASGREYELAAGEASMPSLPWQPGDAPDVAFASFVNAIGEPNAGGQRNPQLNDLLDYYLRMVWQLSLAAPLPYVDEHPFDSVLSESRQYILNGPGPTSVSEHTGSGPLREAAGWPARIGVAEDFKVIFDDLELRRPLKFSGLAETSNAVKTPMIFAGHLRDEFLDLPVESTGGPLEFYAYLMWMPKVIPIDDVGSLIRIHGASGSGFDETFLKYQVAETTRLKQISCEIFVVQGLEGALNIDRESYNFSHTHVVRLTSWLHTALSRSIGTQKSLANVIRRNQRDSEADRQVDVLESIVSDFWLETLGSDADSPVPPVVWSDSGSKVADEHQSDAIRLSREHVLRATGASKRLQRAESQMGAIAQVLAAMNLLEDLDEQQVERLMAQLAKIVMVDE